jgi:DNA-binding NarL/FixJ family response regulator
MSAARPIRVLLVDDHWFVRAALTSLCDAEPDLRVVGETDNGRQALVLCAELHPDLVILDQRMPGMDGLACLAELQRMFPGVRVLMHSVDADARFEETSRRAGAHGFLPKSAGRAALLETIRGLFPGGPPSSGPPRAP